MSLIYDKILNFISNDKYELSEIKSGCDAKVYFDCIESHILSEILALTKNTKYTICKNCLIGDDNTIVINDAITNILNNIIIINSKYYVVTKCIKYTKNIDLTEELSYYKINVYPEIKLISDDAIVVKIIGYIGDKLHELSSLIQIMRNKSEHTNILESIINPSAYFCGEYSNCKSRQLKKCNKNQQKAIKSLKHSLEIIHGPPGTGKTTTIINILSEKIPDDHTILCTAVQNQAIESLVMKLMIHDKLSKCFAVFGDSMRLKYNSANYSIEKMFENDDIVNKLNKKITKYRNELEILINTSHFKELHATKVLKNDVQKNIMNAKEKIEEYETKLMIHKSNILKKIKIFISTIGSSHKVYSYVNRNIDTIILDEAGATTEMQLFPLIRLNPKNMILIGDHKQLSAFTQHGALDDICYNKSLLERMIDSKRKHHLLTQQYRMHNDICKLVSKLFYNKLLRSDESRIVESNKNIEWVNICYKSEQCGTSFSNKGEANIIEQLCNNYKNRNILILTFYNAQLDLLNNRFKKGKVICRSIDSCQGMESDIVIVSLVKSGKISKFMRDPKRICVMLSRAINKIIIVGESDQFYNIDIWKKIINASHISKISE